MKKALQAKLDRILQQHALWVRTEGAQGARANLAGARLVGADLTRARLAGVNLAGADLTGASLFGANLSNVYLYQANLTRAQIDARTQLHQCSNFKHLTCSPGALPWLILHPKWSEWKSTVTVVEDNPK